MQIASDKKQNPNRRRIKEQIILFSARHMIRRKNCHFSFYFFFLTTNDLYTTKYKDYEALSKMNFDCFECILFWMSHTPVDKMIILFIFVPYFCVCQSMVNVVNHYSNCQLLKQHYLNDSNNNGTITFWILTLCFIVFDSIASRSNVSAWYLFLLWFRTIFV